MSQRILLSALAFTLALTVLVVVSPDVEATLSMDCYCASGGSTAERWGFGSSCTEAEDDLRAELDLILPDAVDQTCAPFCASSKRACDVILDLTGCKHIGGGEYQADGHYDFGCYACP